MPALHNRPARPAVSILMPVLNAEATLSEALESVLHQTTSATWELLVIDDGSTDASLALARRYAQTHPDCVRILQHASGRNRGTSASRNLGLAHARGRVLAMLDADDVWLPEMLESQLALLTRYPEADMVYANAERTWDMALPFHPVHGSEGDNELPALLPPGASSGLLPATYPLPWFLADDTLVPCTCTVLVRMEAVRAVGGFEASFQGLYDDQAFYAKLMLNGRVAVSEACVARYRRLPTSCCGQTWHNQDLQQRAHTQFVTWLHRYRATLEQSTVAFAAAD